MCPTITSLQRQVIIGTVLGGSSIVHPKTGRSCYLSMRGNNAKWLECKAQELKFIKPPNPYFGERQGYFRWHSSCSPALNDFHSMFYKDKKKVVNMDILNELRDIGLAVWFVDGAIIRKDEVIFKTSVFGEDGSNTISQYFTEIDLSNKVVKDKTSFRVVLDGNSSSKFIDIIADSVPNFVAEGLHDKLS